MPAYLLVKLSRTRATRLEGLDECVLPVEPVSTNYRIRVQAHTHSPTIVRKGKRLYMSLLTSHLHPQEASISSIFTSHYHVVLVGKQSGY